MERPASKISLEYLPESDRREMLEEWKVPSSLEDSVVWKQLNDLFVESVGKCRVFCHPGARNTLEAAISQSVMEQIVEASVRYVQK